MSTTCQSGLYDGLMHRPAQSRDGKTPGHFDHDDSHPTTGASPAEIASHIVRVHYRTLGQRLLLVGSLIDKVAAQHRSSREWPAVGRRFAELHDELVRCLLQERCIILPAFVTGQSPGKPGLRDAVRTVSKTHARVLQRFWALSAQLAAAISSVPTCGATEALAAELPDLVDDYYQHLFEEECLLFPQLSAERPVGAGAIE